MSIADLGSGCGITGNTFAKFGCKVLGIEVHEKSCEIARKHTKKAGVPKGAVQFLSGAVK